MHGFVGEKFAVLLRPMCGQCFVVSDLAGIDPMYQNSLSYFKKLFNYSIETSSKVSYRTISLIMLSLKFLKKG